MEDSKSKFARAELLMPREEVLELGRQQSKLRIGVPRETTFQENRVALVPDGVELLVRHGHQVVIESGAGNASHFSDHEYSEAGAGVVAEASEVFKSDLVLKIQPVTDTEMEWLRPRQTLISALQVGMQREAYFRGLMQRKVTALAFELIRDRTEIYPVIHAMSEIAGSASILLAAELLCDTQYGLGKMFGGFSGIPPSEVVIIGAGTVGEYAARSAMGLGAQVKVFDLSVYRLRRLQKNLGARIFTSIIHHHELEEAMRTADVVIGALHAKEGRTPCLISGEMIRKMKEGSLVIDISIDQGGCFETSRPTTHKNPVYKENGITHYCVPNIPSRFPYTASQALNNIFVPMLIQAGTGGGIENLLKDDLPIRDGVYIYNGILTNSFIGRMFSLPYQDISLLMASLR